MALKFWRKCLSIYRRSHEYMGRHWNKGDEWDYLGKYVEEEEKCMVTTIIR